MATDLTVQLKEIFASTIETSLSSIIEVEDVTKASTTAIKSKQLILVDVSYTFSDKQIDLRYIVNIPLVSLMFHSMMFEEYKLEETIDNDMLDALKELISQVSGALETAINAENYPDINEVKFSLKEAQIYGEKTYTKVGELFKFNININSKPFSLFLDIDETTLEYFDELKALPDAPEEPEEVQEEEVEEPQEEVQEESEESTNQETSEETSETEDFEVIKNENNEIDDSSTPTQEESETDTSKKEDTEDKESQDNIDEENQEQIEPKEEIDNKNKKLKLVVIILGALIGIIIITTIVLYFMGVFDEPEVIEDQNTTKPKVSKEELIISELENKYIDFNMGMIDPKRLNKRLSLLTKYEILEEDIVKIYQEREKERLHQLKIAKLEEFAQKNKEESLFKATISKELDEAKESRFSEDNISKTNTIEDEQFLNEMLTFIKVDPIEYKNFKNIITTEKTKTTTISMCKDSNGKVNIFVGPMYINLETNNIIKAVKKKYKGTKSISLTQMTRKEFNTMCNF